MQQMRGQRGSSVRAVDHLLGRAFSSEIVRREIEQITDLNTAKEAARMLLQQVEIQRQMMDLLVRMDWLGPNVL